MLKEIIIFCCRYLISDHFLILMIGLSLNFLLSLPQDAGGMMTLTDAFCRLNRARGLELVSPDDLLNACAELNKGGAAASSLALHTFDGTGVMVLRYVLVYHISCT